MPLPSMTYDRVKALLDREGLTYDVDASDGDITFGFINMMVWINLDERTLRSTGAWRGRSTDPRDAEKMIAIAHGINSTQNFPKVYVQGDGSDNEPFSMLMEHSYPVTLGMSDEQLEEYFNASMGMFFSVADACAQELPHLVTWSEEE
ncbi:YbjN domain-containing protein [Schaalia sp. Marseille-Q2122]|uniref:YbjN domain-containing protein n=1 Tax=Schaalia sp. Marseille-Q2122 TaxID=2736604 RepID=UPI00158EDBB9|nr:YbjN domain-containing protein [Schaalia sp. Marseille-Q2122]